MDTQFDPLTCIMCFHRDGLIRQLSKIDEDWKKRFCSVGLNPHSETASWANNCSPELLSLLRLLNCDEVEVDRESDRVFLPLYRFLEIFGNATKERPTESHDDGDDVEEGSGSRLFPRLQSVFSQKWEAKINEWEKCKPLYCPHTNSERDVHFVLTNSPTAEPVGKETKLFDLVEESETPSTFGENVSIEFNVAISNIREPTLLTTGESEAFLDDDKESSDF